MTQTNFFLFLLILAAALVVHDLGKIVNLLKSIEEGGTLKFAVRAAIKEVEKSRGEK